MMSFQIIHLGLDYIMKRGMNVSSKLENELQGSYVINSSQLSPNSKELALQNQSRFPVATAGGGPTSSQVRLNTANSQAAELSDVLSIAPKRIGRRNEMGHLK